MCGVDSFVFIFIFIYFWSIWKEAIGEEVMLQE